MDGLVVLGLFWVIVFGALCAFVAEQKGRSAGNWFVLGALLGVFALIALAAVPASKQRTSAPKTALDRARTAASIKQARERRAREWRSGKHGD